MAAKNISAISVFTKIILFSVFISPTLGWYDEASAGGDNYWTRTLPYQDTNSGEGALNPAHGGPYECYGMPTHATTDPLNGAVVWNVQTGYSPLAVAFYSDDSCGRNLQDQKPLAIMVLDKRAILGLHIANFAKLERAVPVQPRIRRAITRSLQAIEVSKEVQPGGLLYGIATEDLPGSIVYWDVGQGPGVRRVASNVLGWLNGQVYEKLNKPEYKIQFLREIIERVTNPPKQMTPPMVKHVLELSTFLNSKAGIAGNKLILPGPGQSYAQSLSLAIINDDYVPKPVVSELPQDTVPPVRLPSLFSGYAIPDDMLVPLQALERKLTTDNNPNIPMLPVNVEQIQAIFDSQPDKAAWISRFETTERRHLFDLLVIAQMLARWKEDEEGAQRGKYSRPKLWTLIDRNKIGPGVEEKFKAAKDKILFYRNMEAHQKRNMEALRLADAMYRKWLLEQNQATANVPNTQTMLLEQPQPVVDAPAQQASTKPTPVQRESVANLAVLPMPSHTVPTVAERPLPIGSRYPRASYPAQIVPDIHPTTLPSVPRPEPGQRPVSEVPNPNTNWAQMSLPPKPEVPPNANANPVPYLGLRPILPRPDTAQSSEGTTTNPRVIQAGPQVNTPSRGQNTNLVSPKTQSQTSKSQPGAQNLQNLQPQRSSTKSSGKSSTPSNPISNSQSNPQSNPNLSLPASSPQDLRQSVQSNPQSNTRSNPQLSKSQQIPRPITNAQFMGQFQPAGGSMPQMQIETPVQQNVQQNVQPNAQVQSNTRQNPQQIAQPFTEQNSQPGILQNIKPNTPTNYQPGSQPNPRMMSQSGSLPKSRSDTSPTGGSITKAKPGRPRKSVQPTSPEGIDFYPVANNVPRIKPEVRVVSLNDLVLQEQEAQGNPVGASQNQNNASPIVSQNLPQQQTQQSSFGISLVRPNGIGDPVVRLQPETIEQTRLGPEGIDVRSGDTRSQVVETTTQMELEPGTSGLQSGSGLGSQNLVFDLNREGEALQDLANFDPRTMENMRERAEKALGTAYLSGSDAPADSSPDNENATSDITKGGLMRIQPRPAVGRSDIRAGPPVRQALSQFQQDPNRPSTRYGGQQPPAPVPRFREAQQAQGMMQMQNPGRTRQVLETVREAVETDESYEPPPRRKGSRPGPLTEETVVTTDQIVDPATGTSQTEVSGHEDVSFPSTLTGAFANPRGGRRPM
ncbi:hypothetical protein H072_5390 [Dactylellina haptotyla CBS 200.50]|uniref:Uncharacterized protein n=1 Tax=Dactylellina haptotyla (strain CBS 200.50) TaxID=1284197 RepID=S8ACK6_DACHA|nr:hypothetical protein H072_5390 [Dactylellina haptotyla CBS 200.50]